VRYTLSLHDALPICVLRGVSIGIDPSPMDAGRGVGV